MPGMAGTILPLHSFVSTGRLQGGEVIAWSHGAGERRARTHTYVRLPARLSDLTVVTVLEISAPASRWAQYKDVPG